MHGIETRILIYRIGQVGDTIAALPALWALRRYLPAAHLTLLTDNPSKDSSNCVQARRVLPPNGLIDSWLTYTANDSWRRTPSMELLALLLRLQRQRFGTLVYLAPRLRKSWQVFRDLAFFRLAGIRHVIGQRGIGVFPPRQLGKPLPMLEHEADHLLRRLAAGGIPVPDSGAGEMNLALTDTENEAVEYWLQTRVPGYPSNVRLVGIGPGSKWPSKLWPEERFDDLGKRLINELQLYPVVFGGPEDEAMGDRLIRKWGTGINAAGALDVRPAAAALRRCLFYAGNDTGTMHLAAAVGTPCVAIFSAQDWPGRWHPYGQQHTVLRRFVPCEGCLLQVCEYEGLRCLKEISVADVFCACQKTLKWQDAHTRDQADVMRLKPVVQCD